MKKIITCTLLYVCVNVVAFSLDSNQLYEYWSGMGFDFGNTFELSDAEKTYIASPGFNVHGYSFPNSSNFGGVVRLSLLFPVIESGIENNYRFQGDMFAGFAGRLSLSESLKVYGGLGLNVGMLNAFRYTNNNSENLDYSKTLFMSGLGSDLGLKYDITDLVYINIGCSLSFFFFNTSTTLSYNENTSQYQRIVNSSRDSILIGIKPYIGVGINTYLRSFYGKPKVGN